MGGAALGGVCWWDGSECSAMSDVGTGGQSSTGGQSITGGHIFTDGQVVGTLLVESGGVSLISLPE